MTLRIVWGALATDAGLMAALGRLPQRHSLALHDHALLLDAATALRVLVAAPGATARVTSLPDLTDADLAVLDFVETALGADEALSDPLFKWRRAAAGLPGAETAGLGQALIEAILRCRGEVAAPALARRRGPMAVAAASRLRAAEGAPTSLRHRATPGDLRVDHLRHPYGGFFAVEERDTTWRRFDGTMSPVVPRAVFIAGDAVTVLPYDPVRDRVLVVEQFRAGPQARGDAQPWSLEAIAGRIDPGEAPETAARREAVEEAGLTLTELRFVARYYPSPGAVSEYIWSYVALTDLPDGACGIFGREDEAEDIRGHLIGFAELMALVQSGEVENSPLILTALWLERERKFLR